MTSVNTPAAEEELFVERNARGGWSLRFSNDPVDQQMGNYPSAQDAARIASLNVKHWRIIDDTNPPTQHAQTHQ